MTSPTQRTLAALREAGWVSAITEHWNSYARIRQDLFGFIDIVAIKPGTGIMGIQCTTGGNVASRIKKIQSIPAALTWLESGGLLEVWGWSKKGPRGKRKLLEVRMVSLRAVNGQVVVIE